MATQATIFKSDTGITWCPGCGDFAVLSSLQGAMAALDLDPDQTLVVSGIGCSSNLPHFLKTYGYHSLHGRALPVATGAKLANKDLTVITTGGDGDGYGIGLGHFIHAMRRNFDITYIVMNNSIYGLTTGQTSPTSQKGHKTKSTPEGNLENPINPIALALSSGATFVSRGFSGDPKHLTDLMTAAIKHKGFSLVDVFSPCVTYNKINTYQWFRDSVYKLEDEKHDTENILKAFEKGIEWGPRIPTGVFYKTQKDTYDGLEPAIAEKSLVKQPLGLKKDQFDSLLNEFY